MEQDQNRFINIEGAKSVAVIILCFSLVAVICVTSIMMSSSSIKPQLTNENEAIDRNCSACEMNKEDSEDKKDLKISRAFY